MSKFKSNNYAKYQAYNILCHMAPSGLKGMEVKEKSAYKSRPVAHQASSYLRFLYQFEATRSISTPPLMGC